MSGSGERRRVGLQAEDEEADAVEVVEISGPAPAKAPRRCVQTKLNFFMSPKGGGRGRGGGKEEEEEEEVVEVKGESSPDEDGGRRKPKRKRKAPTRTPTKVPVISKEAVGFNTGNKKMSPTVGDGSDFFLKVSEKRLKQKHQKVQEDAVDLIVEGDTCSKKLQSVGKKSRGKLKVQKLDFMPCKDLLSSNPEEPKSRWWLTSGKLSASKVPDAHDLSEYQPTMVSCSESKHTVERNVHALATRSTHPFFSRWRTKENKNYFSALDEEMLIPGPPLHVFETPQDAAASPDWGHWKISERSSLDLSESMCPESNSLAVSDVSIAPLKFDCTSLFLNPSGDVLPQRETHLVKILDQPIDLFEGSEGTSSVLTDKRGTDNQHISYLDMPQGSRENVFSRCTGSLNNLGNERQSGLSQESLTVYQLRRDCWNECGLWTNKYQPDKAVEVCGNAESVRFLSEWLKSWQERHLQTTKSSISSCAYIKDDSDDSLYQNDSDSENEDEAYPGNVLLVTGPVGCGKSAAIYASAKEQGFQVIEVNTSDERNGAHIKQKFGESMDSHAIELCSIEDAVDLRRKHALPLMMDPSVNTVAIEFKNVDSKVASRSCKATRNECHIKAVENQSSTCRVTNRNLFLFEDVDAVFDEDRGFIASIMQLAETSKRPIILTTNSKNPILPRALNKLVVDFTRPSTEELLVHMLMVCAAEGAQASPLLLERLIRSCQGDIRKTILLLQFWCQGGRGQQDSNIQCAYSPLLFDLDAAHWVITNIIPWEIPCELSLKVEEEITKVTSAAENIGILYPLKEDDDMIGPIDGSNTNKDGTGTCTAEENAMVKNKCPISQYAEFLSPIEDNGDFSDGSGSPLTFARRSLKHRTDTVLSSQSGDVFAADTTIEFRSPKANSTLSPGACEVQYFQPTGHPNYANLFDDPFGESANLSRDPFMIDEMASTSHVCDTYLSMCIPESSLVPETEISNREGCLSTTSSQLSGNLEDFLMSNVGSMQALAEVNNVNGIMLATPECPINEFLNIHELDTESVHGNEEPGVSQKEAVVHLSRGFQLMDECSRAGFGMELMTADSFKCHPVVGSVEETWRNLRNCHEDLNSYLSPCHKDATKILDLASGLTDLISEADILLRRCQLLTNDFLKPSSIPFDETCSSSWYDDHLEMACTFAQHGFCLYASKAATMQKNLSYEIPLHLTQEMLAASTSSMALGKLLSQQKTAITNLCTKRGSQESSRNRISLGRELESMLCDAVRPTIPARLYMALKGPAFHEYISFLSCMSKSENSRLADNKDHFCRHQRVRASRHYLRSLPFVMTPEDVALLAGYGCFGEVDFR